MDKKTELVEALRLILRDSTIEGAEVVDAVADGARIIINNPIVIVGSDVGTITAIKMLLRASRSSSARPDPAPERKPAAKMG